MSAHANDTLQLWHFSLFPLDRQDANSNYWNQQAKNLGLSNSRLPKFLSSSMLSFLLEKNFAQNFAITPAKIEFPFFVPFLSNSHNKKFVYQSKRGKPLLNQAITAKILNKESNASVFMPLSFSISHSGHSLAIAFSTNLTNSTKYSCGFDLEIFNNAERKLQGLRQYSRARLEAIAKRFFNTFEYQEIMESTYKPSPLALSPEQGPSSENYKESFSFKFFQIWCRKEAAAKALDQSLFKTLNRSTANLAKKLQLFTIPFFETLGFSAALTMPHNKNLTHSQEFPPRLHSPFITKKKTLPEKLSLIQCTYRPVFRNSQPASTALEAQKTTDFEKNNMLNNILIGFTINKITTTEQFMIESIA